MILLYFAPKSADSETDACTYCTKNVYVSCALLHSLTAKRYNLNSKKICYEFAYDLTLTNRIFFPKNEKKNTFDCTFSTNYI